LSDVGAVLGQVEAARKERHSTPSNNDGWVVDKTVASDRIYAVSVFYATEEEATRRPPGWKKWKARTLVQVEVLA
jgi:hypothetical protein